MIKGREVDTRVLVTPGGKLVLVNEHVVNGMKGTQ